MFEGQSGDSSQEKKITQIGENMKIDKNIRSRQTDIVIQHLNGETLIYDLQADKAFCLNETSALVYELCDGNHSAAEMSRKLSEKLRQNVTEDFVWLAIDDLKKNKLLADADQIETRFAGVSRREAIRKVGFASLVALPVIASLVAPTVVEAASGCPTCTASTPPGQICSVGGAGCLASNALGSPTTACPGNCRYCVCTIPNGQSSCTSTCGTFRGF
jgi:hypothetical protein